jgi:hypothetical protein
MRASERCIPLRGLLALAVGIGLLSVAGCTGQEGAASGSGPSAPAKTRTVPRLASAPRSPRLMQVYFDTGNGREWIFDGARWVPHDDTVEEFTRALPSKDAGAPRPEASSLAGATFVPTGAHAKHRAYDCTTCHTVGGSPCFDPAGKAVAAGRPAPTFDTAGKTCNSVACHGAYSGTFVYTRWNYDIDDVDYVTYAYTGTGGTTTSWYVAGSTCSSCHGNPPTAVNPWHSSGHGGSLATGRNCEICHPDAVSATVGGRVVGVSINATNAAMHGNGTVNVVGKFTSKCFGCH